jgi:hypothetical protein
MIKRLERLENVNKYMADLRPDRLTTYQSELKPVISQRPGVLLNLGLLCERWPFFLSASVISSCIVNCFLKWRCLPHTKASRRVSDYHLAACTAHDFGVACTIANLILSVCILLHVAWSGYGGLYPSMQRHYRRLILLCYYAATCFGRTTIFMQKIYNSLRITQLTTDPLF